MYQRKEIFIKHLKFHIPNFIVKDEYPHLARFTCVCVYVCLCEDGAGRSRTWFLVHVPTKSRPDLLKLFVNNTVKIIYN